MRRATAAAALIGILAQAPLRAVEPVFSGQVDAETRLFWDPPRYPGQSGSLADPSVDADLSLAPPRALGSSFDYAIEPYLRWDAVDPHRDLLDLHRCELTFDRRGVRLKAGYDVVAWGVLDFVNPVDVLNQADVLDDFLGRRRLGQPMLDLTWTSGLGALDAIVLAGFRPMALPGVEGRLRPGLAVSNAADYQGGWGWAQPEAALHYSETLGAFYLGLSYFRGYRPQPDFGLAFQGGMPTLLPQYVLEQQAGFEGQWTLESLTLKTEDVVRLNLDGTRGTRACGFGARYDQGALFAGGPGLALLAEFDADELPQTLVVPFTNDVFAGFRLSFNDASSTDLTAWMVWDRNLCRPVAAIADLHRRVGDWVGLDLGYRGILAGGVGPFADLSADSHALAKVDVYF